MLHQERYRTTHSQRLLEFDSLVYYRTHLEVMTPFSVRVHHISKDRLQRKTIPQKFKTRVDFSRPVSGT